MVGVVGLCGAAGVQRGELLQKRCDFGGESSSKPAQRPPRRRRPLNARTEFAVADSAGAANNLHGQALCRLLSYRPALSCPEKS
jgi:hypothetical protein